MTQDEIIRMAIDAGLGEYLHLDGWRFTPDGDDIKSLERFYELAYATGAAHERERVMNEPLTKAMWDRFESEIRADEREACAKVCEQGTGEAVQKVALEILLQERNRITKAIRARGEK